MHEVSVISKFENIEKRMLPSGREKLERYYWMYLRLVGKIFSTNPCK